MTAVSRRDDLCEHRSLCTRRAQVFYFTAVLSQRCFHPVYWTATDPRFDFFASTRRSSYSVSGAFCDTLSSDGGCNTSVKPGALGPSNRSLPRTVAKPPQKSLPGCRSSSKRRPISIDLPVSSPASNGVDSRGAAGWRLSCSSARSSIAIEMLLFCNFRICSPLLLPTGLGSFHLSCDGRGDCWLVKARTKVFAISLI